MKYFRIYKKCIENAISYEAQYRADTWMKLITNLFFLAMLFVTIEVVFNHTNAIVGWEKHEVYLMSVVWLIADELYTVIFKANIMEIPHMVTDGQLDMYVTKPVSALFLVTTRVFLFRAFLRLLMQFAVLGWLIYQFDFSPTPTHILFGMFFLFMGVVMQYSMGLFLNTLSFWFMRIDNINEAWEGVQTIGRYPIDVLPKFMKILAFTALPIALQAYVPVLGFTGRATWEIAAYVCIFTAFLFIFAVAFWNFALRRYSSASS